jgi:NDP-sugar pyrophosphorylase family protein
MLHIDYGLGILDPGVLRDGPADACFDLVSLYGDLIRRGLLAGFEVRERFYEIGSPAGLSETDSILRQRAAGARS